MGKYFIHRFIPNFTEITKPLNKLLKKDADFKWTKEAKKSFEDVKEAITQELVLVSPDYSKPFQFFSFASIDTIVGVLLQNNDKNEEQPIAFMSKALSYTEMKYQSMKKRAYALVMSLKHFKVFIGYSKIMAYVSHPTFKEILKQQDGLDARAKWIMKIQEYDLEIQPTKLVKGRGLA